MPSGGTESKKNDSQQKTRRRSRGGSAEAKTNDLSAEDWNFLLRWQVPQITLHFSDYTLQSPTGPVPHV